MSVFLLYLEQAKDPPQSPPLPIHSTPVPLRVLEGSVTREACGLLLSDGFSAERFQNFRNTVAGRAGDALRMALRAHLDVRLALNKGPHLAFVVPSEGRGTLKVDLDKVEAVQLDRVDTRLADLAVGHVIRVEVQPTAGARTPP